MRPDTPVQPLPNPIPITATDQILGVPLGLIDYERTLDWIDAMAAEREQGYVCVCNVHTVMASQEDPELRSALLGASLNVPDGQPLVWALNALGHSLSDRVYGPELMARACARAASSGQRLLPVRWPQPGSARAARAQSAPALPRDPDRRRLLATAPAPDRRGAGRGRRRDQRRRGPTSCGSESASPSRRSGWRRSAPTSRLRC